MGFWLSAEMEIRDIYLPSLFPSKEEPPRAKVEPATRDLKEAKGIWPTQGLASNLTARLSVVRLSFVVLIFTL